MPTSEKDLTLRSQHDDPKPEAERLLAADITGQKRKQPEVKKNRFKVTAQLVMAMQRFQASINPTYTFGKRTSSSGGSVERRGSEVPEVASRPGTAGTASPRPGDRRVSGTFPDRGHKADYLFRPLPGAAELAGGSAADKAD